MIQPVNETCPKSVRAIVTDWAGTIVDYGSCAPTTAVIEAFAREGVTITPGEAREPMGRAKRDHLATVVRMPRVAACWAKVHGREPNDADVDRLYLAFLPLQMKVLAELSHAIPGVAKALAQLRSSGLKIGSTTGYTRELMAVVTAVARAEGVEADVVMTADDVQAGRPAPWLIFRAAEQLGVYPMSAIVAVDDTPVGIQAARNAGTWAVGVSRTGNALGLPHAAAMALAPDQWASRRKQIEAELLSAGAHWVIDSFEDLIDVIPQIDSRLARGEQP